MKLGSLFDGIGAFPLAAVRAGIRPVWASEIEKAPVSITRRHFPEMEHIGDITKLDGAGIEPVDIITFGSPCQDLSIAGRRAGLRGRRSSLFLEAVRIIKEMRVATDYAYPARIVWENVPGAFSSNGGGDFRTVIEQIAGIAEPGISVPRPADGWLAAGAVLGNGWSLAWRVLNAQYWGVPQRRSRIFLVADFGGRCAGKILFNPESGSGDYQAVGRTWESCAGNAESGLAQDSLTYCMTDNYAETAVYVRGGEFGVYRLGDIGSTIRAKEENRSGDLVVMPHSVRRLTPLEHERLQGFPDFWTLYGHDGRVISDGQRFKALGNSIAVPCVQFILDGMRQ